MSKPIDLPYPNCFGNLLTDEYVITATSCFLSLNGKYGLLKLFEDPPYVPTSLIKTPVDLFNAWTLKYQNKMFKSAIDKMFIVRVCIDLHTK